MGLALAGLSDGYQSDKAPTVRLLASPVPSHSPQGSHDGEGRNCGCDHGNPPRRGLRCVST